MSEHAVKQEGSAPKVDATLLARLQRLERESQRFNRATSIFIGGMAILLGLTVTLLVLFVKGPRTGDIVQARSFVLRDASGQVRATLGMTAEGSAQFVLNDEAGHPRARLSVLSDGSAGLALVDAGGLPRAALGLLSDDISLVFADRDGRGRTVLGLTAREASSLVFADRSGATRAGLGVNPDGRAALTVRDGN